MGRLDGQSAVYQALNIVGAAGFIINGWWHGAIPSSSLNIVWMLIGAFALWRISRRQAMERRATDVGPWSNGRQP